MSAQSAIKTVEVMPPGEAPIFDLNIPYTFKCQLCPFYATDQSTVTQHYQIAHYEQSEALRGVITVGAPVDCKLPLFQCSQCEYSTHKRGNLNAHIQQMHTEQRPYPCPHCDYRAKTERHLHAHIPTHGGDTPPYKCNFCSFESSDRSVLVRHKQDVHESDKVFSCEQCTYKARTSDYLAKHKVTQHTPLSERQFQCAHCSKKFAIESLLRRHLKKHLDNTRHNCVHCGNAFKDIRRHRSRCTKAPDKATPKPKEPTAKDSTKPKSSNHKNEPVLGSLSNDVAFPQLVQMPSLNISSMISLQNSLKGVALNSMMGLNQNSLLLGTPLVSTVRVLPLDVEGVQST